MTVERTHFVQPDFEHVSLDLLLKAPLNIGGAAAPKSMECTKMGRTIAEMFIDKGRVEGRVEGQVEGKMREALDSRRAILVRLLRKRFKKVPRKVQARIDGTTDLQELESWLDNFAEAKSLAEVGIPSD